MSSTNDSGQQEILLNQELLNIYRRNLAHQLQRAARFGGEADAPLDVVNSILEQRNQIRQIKAILRANGVAVVDNPNDEPLSPTDTSQPRRRRRQKDMPHAKVNDPWNWQSYRALLIWIVGLLVLVTAVFAVKDALLPSSTPATTVAIPGTPTVNPILAAVPDSDIRLVDVSVLAEGNLPALDIKVRNVGGKIAILKKAIVHVADYEIFPIFGCATYAPPPSPLAFSAKYDVDLRNSTTQAINLSQSVSPNDVDRFKIVLGTAPTHHGSWILYRLNLELIYNEDNRSVTSPPIIV